MRFVCESCSSPFATEDRSAARCPRCGGLLRPETRSAPSPETVRAVEGVLDWFVAVEDEPVGPLAAAAVRARWETGQVGPASLCWRPGLADWQAIAELRDLHEYLRASGRPAPPSAAAAPATPAEFAATVPAPGSGNGLAALAGTELAGLAAAGPRPGLLDLLTSPRATTRVVNSALPQSATRPTAPAAPMAPASQRRLSGVAAFCLGAALTGMVALALFARPPRPTADAPLAAATPPVTAPSTPAATAPAPGAAAKPERAPEAGEPAVARAEVAPSPSPVRASDPPAAAKPEPRPNPKPAAPHAATSRAEPQKPKATRTAAKTTAPSSASAKPAAASAAPAAGSKLAMASPSPAKSQATSREPELPPAPDAGAAKPPAAKTTPRDPLLDAVTDDELERELSGGAAKPAPKASSTVYVPPAQPGSDLPESVTPAQINDAVGAQVGALKGCIEEQRAGDPGAKGTLKLRWVIAGDGSVREVKNLSSEYEGQPIARCIGGVVKGIRFPATRARGQEVVFPFKF